MIITGIIPTANDIIPDPKLIIPKCKTDKLIIKW